MTLKCAKRCQGGETIGHDYALMKTHQWVCRYSPILNIYTAFFSTLKINAAWKTLVTNSTGDGFSPQRIEGKQGDKRRKEAQILGWPSERGASVTLVHTHTHIHTCCSQDQSHSLGTSASSAPDATLSIKFGKKNKWCFSAFFSQKKERKGKSWLVTSPCGASAVSKGCYE